MFYENKRITIFTGEPFGGYPPDVYFNTVRTDYKRMKTKELSLSFGCYSFHIMISFRWNLGGYK